MAEPPISTKRTWTRKFRDAFRGVRKGMRDQSSFVVHFSFAAATMAMAVIFRVTAVEWCLLVLSITGVLATELVNSALESMAKAITGESDPHLGNSLDIGSAAVLFASIGAATVGVIIFGHHLAAILC
jgi:diacylglycerol kinase